MMRNKRILGGALLLSMSLLGGGLNMGFSNNGQPAIVKAADTKSQSALAGWNTGKEVTYKGSEATFIRRWEKCMDLSCRNNKQDKILKVSGCGRRSFGDKSGL